MIKTVGELKKILEKYEDDTVVKIEITDEIEDFVYYTKIFSVYEVKNPSINHHEVIIETN